MEQKVHQFAASARLRSVDEPEESSAPINNVSLESRLREAREKRERVLAERASADPDGKSTPERRGKFEFGPAPFDRDAKKVTEGLPFPGSGLPLAEVEAATQEVQQAQPDKPVPAHGSPNFIIIPEDSAGPVDVPFPEARRPHREQVMNPKISEGSAAPAEMVDSSKWDTADQDDNIFINPKIVESMLPFVPYQVSGDDDPWFSASAKKKLKDKGPRLVPLAASAFIPAGEKFDLGTPVELKAVFDEVTYVHVRQRRKMRLVRVIAIAALVVAGVIVYPVIKGGFQPAFEAILLNPQAN